jgi:hypothetical protein
VVAKRLGHGHARFRRRPGPRRRPPASASARPIDLQPRPRLPRHMCASRLAQEAHAPAMPTPPPTRSPHPEVRAALATRAHSRQVVGFQLNGRPAGVQRHALVGVKRGGATWRRKPARRMS